MYDEHSRDDMIEHRRRALADRTLEALAATCRRRFGDRVRVGGLRRLSAGASSQTWRFTLSPPAAAVGETGAAALAEDLVLQIFAGGRQYPGALDKATQARVQQAASAAGVPTPDVRFLLEPTDGLGDGFVTRWCDGETLGQRIASDERYAQARAKLTADCGGALAAIHRVDPAVLPPLPTRRAGEGLRLLADTHRGYGASLPVFELALQWLQDHVPADAHAATLVHGDFRNGNLLVDDSGLASVLDWEMAHLGDPMEDFGWLTVNAWRFGRIDWPVGGFGQREHLYRAYEAHGGRRVERDSVRFWQTFGTLQWGVMCQWFAAQFLDGSVREIERVAIGRRISEVQVDLMDLLRGRD